MANNKNSLFILPFDHRSSFMKKMFGIANREPTAEETEVIGEFKQITYQGFRLAVDQGLVPKESAAILVDEQFGDAVLRDAKKNGYRFCLAVEKSGQDEFDFEYGDEFKNHVEKYQPPIVKALVRYNPGEEDKDLNPRQRERLKTLSDFCHVSNYQFLIEPLIPATAKQLAKVNGDGHRYDNELRPALAVVMVKELQTGGVEPDIWKIEGLENAGDYEKLVKQMRSGGRDRVEAIVLGRGADGFQVEKWLKAGAGVDGIIGFAIGRTIFWQPLVDYKENKINREETASQISQNYHHFYQVFKG